jgi:molybdenum cofactor cytidylyltransferase
VEPTAAARKIAGVLLAAGMSSRMGQNKLFLSLGGRTVLERAVATAIEAGLDPLVVVVGHEADRVRAALAGSAAVPAFNPDHARGQNTSIAVGVAALPPDADAAVVMLADMPRVDAAMIRGLVAAFRERRPPLVASRYGDVVAPPILYGASLFAELRALGGERCGKAIVRRHRDEAIELAWPVDRLSDLDTPEDVARLAGAGSA